MISFSDLCNTCRTFRRFKQIPISKEILYDIVKNMRGIPSARNKQPLRYIIIHNPIIVEKVQAFFHFAAALPPELGQPKQGEQPTAFILICIENESLSNSAIDIGIAVRTLQLGAWEKQIGSCILGNVEFNKVMSTIGEIHTSWKLTLALALGYPAHQSHIINIPKNQNIAYTIDENKNYYVPKRLESDILLWK